MSKKIEIGDNLALVIIVVACLIIFTIAVVYDNKQSEQKHSTSDTEISYH